MPFSLKGVWEGGPDRFQGEYIFADTHYGGLFTAIGRNQFEADNPSVEQEAEAFPGTYSVAG